jgi:hypothetical protein
MAGRISYYGGIVTNGLVLNLDAGKKDSYNQEGTNWNDLSGNRNNGTLTNFGTQTTWNSDNGGSIVFDGTNDYVTVPNSTLWDFLGSFSLECWVYVNSYDSFGSFLLQQQSAGSNGGVELYVYIDNTVRLNANGGTSMVISSNTFLRGRWNHVVATYEGTTAKIYLNTSNIGTNVSASPPSNVAGQLRIGSYASFGFYELNGKMSCVRIYNGKALSSQEVLQNYNALKGRYNL